MTISWISLFKPLFNFHTLLLLVVMKYANKMYVYNHQSFLLYELW